MEDSLDIVVLMLAEQQGLDASGHAGPAERSEAQLPGIGLECSFLFWPPVWGPIKRDGLGSDVWRGQLDVLAIV